MHLSAKYASTWYRHIGPWTWGLRWVDVPFRTLMCLSWKPCGHAVDVPFGDLMGLRAPARTPTEDGRKICLKVFGSHDEHQFEPMTCYDMI